LCEPSVGDKTFRLVICACELTPNWDSHREYSPASRALWGAYFGLWHLAEKLGLQEKAKQYKAQYEKLWQGSSPPEYLQM
jgi:hypothetical protein